MKNIIHLIIQILFKIKIILYPNIFLLKNKINQHLNYLFIFYDIYDLDI